MGRGGGELTQPRGCPQKVESGHSLQGAPALIVFFTTEERLGLALRPITILEYKAEVMRFTAEKETFISIVEYGIWLHHPNKIKPVFEEQAITRVKA